MTVVREFHEAFGLTVADRPQVPSDDDLRLRKRLIEEEYDEVMAELATLRGYVLGGDSLGDMLPCLARLLKELADLRYVVEGTAVSLGLPIDEAYEEVHRSNMTKVWPDGSVRRDAGGKVMRPPTYERADVASLLGVVEGSVDG